MCVCMKAKHCFESTFHNGCHMFNGCMHVKVNRFTILVFLSESNHKIDFHIKYVEIFFILMINMKMFFDFRIIIFFLCPQYAFK